MSPITLRDSLDYEPVPLKFGTSGRRGEVVHLTQLEIYINALAELEHLLGLPPAQGGLAAGSEFYYATDLRPSSTRLSPAQGGRGEIAQAVHQAILDAGLRPVYLGPIPTPALTSYALQNRCGSIMVTGSHIPFDRNGYKTNSAKGELLKSDEAPINARSELVRQRIYSQAFESSLFDPHGMLKAGSQALPAPDPRGVSAYLNRYLDFFPPQALSGLKLAVYQHSAVGRDFLVTLLERLGAQVFPFGRSETFVPIDTEAIDADLLAEIERSAAPIQQRHGPIDAVVSTDGDSDRPLLLGVESSTAPDAASLRLRFFGGDLVGMLVAHYLGADAVVVPISCNDAIDRGSLASVLQPKTRIGSPFVIAGMESALAQGRKAVCGWEANGGFLLGSDARKDGRYLRALPTRDALLPILAILHQMRLSGCSMTHLFGQLPHRYSRAALLRRFPRATSLKIVEALSPGDPRIKEVRWTRADLLEVLDSQGSLLELDPTTRTKLQGLPTLLAGFFQTADGFARVQRANFVDGVRLSFQNGDVAHVRPSGNADELRIYAVADTQERADAIASLGVAEPEGILRSLAQQLG